MGQFNLQDYEPVQDRIPKFYAKYPDGRIITDKIDSSDGVFVFKATLYKSGEEMMSGIVLSTGWAREIDGKGYVNQTSALENCETSAIGRALANIGIHGDKRPSREEMQKAQKGMTDKDHIISAIECQKSMDDLNKYRTGVKDMIQAKRVKLSKEDLALIGSAFTAKEKALGGNGNEAHQ